MEIRLKKNLKRVLSLGMTPEISDLNKKLIVETDMQARATIQATINELEQKKVKLKFVVDQEASKIASRRNERTAPCRFL